MLNMAALEVWGRADVGGRLAGGARSTVLRVSLGGRDCVARRVAFGEVEARWLHRVLCAAEAAGLAVPVLIPAPDGRFVIGGWTLEPFLSGSGAQPKDLEVLSRSVGRFHARTAGFPPRPGQELVRHSLPAPLAPRIERSWPTGRRTIIHGDIHPGNMIRLPDGRLALVDWEEARRDVVGVDLGALGNWHGAKRAHAAIELSACWQREPIRGRSMARLLRMLG